MNHHGLGRLKAGLLALGLALFGSHGTARAHDYYTGLRNRSGGLCCSDIGRECRPTETCVLPSGREGLVSSRWGCVPIDSGKLVDTPSPDGRPAICEPGKGEYQGTQQSPVIWCEILPGDA